MSKEFLVSFRLSIWENRVSEGLTPHSCRFILYTSEHILTLVNLANLLRDLNAFEKASSVYKKAYKLEPNNVDVLINYGVLFFNHT